MFRSICNTRSVNTGGFNYEKIDATLLPDFKTWTALPLPSEIPHGDMPGDKVCISSEHIEKANLIFPALLEKTEAVLLQNPFGRCVVTVCGGSGVGKSETASLLSYYFCQAGLGSYTLSGDNYPHRIPMYNDAERLRIFREGGIHGLLTSGVYSAETAGILRELWISEENAAPALTEKTHGWPFIKRPDVPLWPPIWGTLPSRILRS